MSEIPKHVKIGKHLVGRGLPCFIVFECGATHSGLESAKKLASAVKEAGADAIKFQMVDPDRIMSNMDMEITFGTPEGQKSENVYKALKRRSLKPEEWKELKAYCDKIDLTFFSTAAFRDEVDLLVKMKSDAIKINAGDVNHYSLIEYAAKTGLPIMLDGRAKFDELEKGVQICESVGNENVVIIHCPSGYPSRNDAVNLRSVAALSKIYKYPIGFSDHSREKLMNYAAIALGADIVEKTLTLNKATPQVEHFMSLEPHEAKEFVSEIRAIEQAYGSARIMFSTKVNEKSRRSMITAADIKKGDTFTFENISFKRPGDKGISAAEYSKVIGKKAAVPIKNDTYIQEDMIA